MPKQESRSPKGNTIELETKNVDSALLALDPNDGHLIAKIPLPANATGSPLTYIARGKQYIVIPVGGASQPAELLALSLRWRDALWQARANAVSVRYW